MEWLIINRENEFYKKDFDMYLFFRWKKELKNSKGIFVATVTMICIVIFVQLYLFISDGQLPGLFSLLFLGFFLTLYPVLFFIQWWRLRLWLRKSYKDAPDTYRFKYDENGIYYESEKFNTEIKWEYFSTFELNEQRRAIYLYTKSKNLSVILERLIGEIHFAEIFLIISTKVKRRYD
ncbi:MAG: hypothetical protein QM725_06215 [Lacibacter sp.]